MRLGVVILPDRPWAAAAPLWQQAERLGFDHAWTYDHLAWRSLRGSPWFAAIPTLTAAALATTRIRLGALVASPNYRHPVPFAKELVSLDDVSAGRITLGLGSGASGWDASALGAEPWSAAERASRFDEFVRLIDRLLANGEVSYAGRFYSAHEVHSQPGCVQRPRIPFAIAATQPSGMRLAAEYATTWVTTGDRRVTTPLDIDRGTRAVAHQLRRLDEVCAVVGRAPSSLRRLVVTGPSLDPGFESVRRFLETVEAYEAIGITDLVVHWPRESPPYDTDRDIFEAAVNAAIRGPRSR